MRSLLILTAALAACLSLFVAIHAGLDWRGFAQIKERKNPAPAPTPRPKPINTTPPMKVIRPTPKPGPRSAPTPTLPPRPAPTPTPIPPPAPVLLRSFSFETVELDRNGREASRKTRQRSCFIVELGDGVTLEMVEVPAGSFLMGSSATEAGRDPDEDPAHRVDVQSFWMGKFEITQAQWKAVMGSDNNSYFTGGELPVENVSWEGAQEFLRVLNRKLRLHNIGRQYQYRLPSEAEWEYAARAGTITPFAFGETVSPQVVNYNSFYPYASARSVARTLKTIEVGGLGVANAFGLFDMHGNVEEWCEDVYHKDYNGAPTDGSAWVSGEDPSHRTLRGGSWNAGGENCRSAERSWIPSSAGVKNLGFRIVVSAIALHSQSRRE
jgi:eukaryotic-like serine/threonine-protein kinase